MDIDELLKLAFLAGFNSSGEGFNGEYPYEDQKRNQKMIQHGLQ